MSNTLVTREGIELKLAMLGFTFTKESISTNPDIPIKTITWNHPKLPDIDADINIDLTEEKPPLLAVWIGYMKGQDGLDELIRRLSQ